MTTVEVRAPATTANLGPGYDCLGMALDLWNTLTVEVLPEGSAPKVVVEGEGAGELEADTRNLTYRAVSSFCSTKPMRRFLRCPCGARIRYR